MKERGWKQGCAIVHTLKYHEISLSDIISMGKQGTFQVYMHNDKIPETISTNGEFSTAMLHCCCERSGSFQNAQMPWILPIDVPMIAVPHGAPKEFPKRRDIRCIWKWRNTKSFQKCIEMHLVLKTKVWNWDEMRVPHFEACQISTVIVWRFKKGSK